MEDDLCKALERNKLLLLYQPVWLRERKLVEFGALICRSHFVRGLVSPAGFISLAEITGLITSIGWWVLRTACEQMVKWQHLSGRSDRSSKPIFISVNITGDRISQPYAGDIIKEILTETGLDFRLLKLKITEAKKSGSSAINKLF